MKIENIIESTNSRKTVVSARIDAKLATEFKALQDKLSEEGYNLRLTAVIEEAMEELLEQSN
jgi:hypothetical protein